MAKPTVKLCMGCMAPLETGTICPHCGYDADTGYDANYIKPGSTLAGRYLVGRVVHKNGEGARYVGYDAEISTPIWIHEYFPYTIAQRGPETGNILPVQGHGAQYKAQISDFLEICNEIRRISATETVVPIENVFSENNTIYAVYRDMNAVPLESYLQSRGGKLSPDEAAELLTPLLNTVSNIHGQGLIHRGICPYTIYIDEQDRPYLWHFALPATRTAGSELKAELFSGYSAPEQYSPSGWQGTWTDVYALGALFYRTLSGTVPLKSTHIGTGRPLKPLADLVMGLPSHMAEAVEDAMKTSADQRTQAVASFVLQVSRKPSGSTTVYNLSKINRPEREMPSYPDSPRRQDSAGGRKKQTREERGVSAKYVALALLLTVAVLGGLIAAFMRMVYPTVAPNQPQTSQDESESQAPSQQSEALDGSDKLVPRFAGKKLAEVQDNSAYKEYYIFRVKEEFSEDWPEGVVYDQTPVEGSAIPSDGLVVLTVSKGPRMVKMPDLVGLAPDAARELLKTLDDSIEPRIFTKYDTSAVPNTILSTTPEKDSEFNPKNQDVILFVSPEQSESESSQESERSSSSGPSDRRSESNVPIIFQN